MDPTMADLGLADFNEKDRKDLQVFLENERQKAKFQDNVHSLTAMCWGKCIAPNKILGPQVDKAEAGCLDNCVNRYIDAQKTVIAQLDRIGRQ
ncbi:Tim10/DDP family zinc finger-domain-containing protein [Tricharina praecox]|uniref:Tim10/DDP family zinc finger-domain-containing protein n=1 Tax=Tricharina praecox TaxID=43433 RepID=UPI0022202878|nr:Tim10/DDP family zinc finger-domain-containing protein [Tricharina praecox]KAI5854815.1 Tim10/DDP family zinc finger-domain-containing protein [Tricharina praecox]